MKTEITKSQFITQKISSMRYAYLSVKHSTFLVPEPSNALVTYKIAIRKITNRPKYDLYNNVQASNSLSAGTEHNNVTNTCHYNICFICFVCFFLLPLVGE